MSRSSVTIKPIEHETQGKLLKYDIISAQDKKSNPYRYKQKHFQQL